MVVMEFIDRKRQRLRCFDYSSGGWYFVTFCTKDRVQILGRIVDGAMELSREGAAVERVLERAEEVVPGLMMGAHVVMPNHVHLLAWLPPGVSLSRAIGSIKSIAAREIAESVGGPCLRVWQKSFHDRIVRDEREYEEIYHYIVTNPERWQDDPLNPHS
jgi:REP element-mobilizing transposase RayT